MKRPPLSGLRPSLSAAALSETQRRTRLSFPVHIATLSMMAPLLLLSLYCAGPARAGSGLNGTDQHAFYIFGHNPNTLAEAEADIKAGANALEPDITTATCNGSEILVDWDSSFPYRGGDCKDTHLTDWLDGAHNLAIQYPQLAFIVFDVKSPAATAAHGVEILNAIRTHLNYGPVNLNVIISVAEQSDGALFDDILGSLGPREGVQVDAENDAGAVVNFFFDKGYFDNIGYGDGTAGPGPNLPRSMDFGAFLRASVGYPKCVTYVYTISEKSSMNSFIDGGVDGIIPDALTGSTTGYIQDLVGVVNNHSELRLATRDDNPFQTPNQAYAIKVRTANDEDLGGEGTDADLTFTLTGCRGSATVTVNAGHINPLYDTLRMEAGGTDYVTLPALNLGKLSSITIHNDGTGIGPDWKLLDLQVTSAKWLGTGASDNYTVSYDDWIDDGDTKTLNLSQNFPDPLPTIQCPASITQGNDPDKCGGVASFSPQVSDLCPGTFAVCSPASGSFFKVGTTTVSCYAQNSAGAKSAPCTFTVTIQDTQKPVITCPSDITTQNDPGECTAVVKFAATASDNCSGVTTTCVPPSGYAFPKGLTTVTCTATDASGNSSTCTFNVTVFDTEPPVLASSVAQPVLWTPNHNMVNIGLAVTATDNCPGALPITVKVYSNEDDQTQTGKGGFSPDAKNIAPGTLRLRSERTGKGHGRVYLIVSSTGDTSGNVAFTANAAVAPLSAKTSAVAAVNALAAAAVSYAQSHNGLPPPGYAVIGDGPITKPKK